MNRIWLTLIFLCTINTTRAQIDRHLGIDISDIPKISFKPAIFVNGQRVVDEIPFDTLMKYGLKVVLADASFKVLQFDVLFSCKSGSLTDFSTKRYLGDSVGPYDRHFQNNIYRRDFIEIMNTVIDRRGQKFVMDYTILVITP